MEFSSFIARYPSTQALIIQRKNMAKLAAAFTRLTLLLAIALLVSSEECVHTIFLKTGDVKDAGTDARVHLKLYDAQGNVVEESNLWSKGVMGSGHDYFERNNVDVFTIPGRCLSPKVCRIELGHDNSGSKAGWYVDYLKVNSCSSSGQCTQAQFDLYQWLATSESPHELSLTRDKCSSIGFNMNNYHFFSSQV